MKPGLSSTSKRLDAASLSIEELARLLGVDLEDFAPEDPDAGIARLLWLAEQVCADA